MSAVEKFPILLSDAEEESSAVPPCFSHEGINVRPAGHSALATPAPESLLLCASTDTGVSASSTFISATATSIFSH
jgi:hypothetical protein